MRSVGFYKSLFNLRSRKIQCHNRSYLIKAKSTIFGFVVFDQRFYLTKQFINFFFVRTHLLHPISYFHCIVVKYHISVILRVHRCLYGKVYDNSISDFKSLNLVPDGDLQRVFL